LCLLKRTIIQEKTIVTICTNLFASNNAGLSIRSLFGHLILWGLC
jgi:hypothetical protein